MYLEDARMWLTRHVQDERRFLALSAVGLLAGTVVAVFAGLFVLGWSAGMLGLIIIGVAYLTVGGFRSEEPVINAQTIRPRLTGVPRSQMGLAWWGPEQIRREMAWVIGMLTAPVHLPVMAWKMMKQRKRLLEVEDSPAAQILALIVERDGAWTFDELCERLGEEQTNLGLGALVDVEPVIWLQEPDRVALTDKAKDAIHAE